MNMKLTVSNKVHISPVVNALISHPIHPESKNRVQISPLDP
jgi:hypothetical protein